MPSVVSGGAMERMTERILFKVMRADSGTPWRYSSTSLVTAFDFAAGGRRLTCFAFFIPSEPEDRSSAVYAPGAGSVLRQRWRDAIATAGGTLRLRSGQAAGATF